MRSRSARSTSARSPGSWASAPSSRSCPGKEGLVRIGELADYHVPTVEDVVSVGDEVMVVVTEIDRQGRVNLSRKAAMQRHLAKDPAWHLGALGRHAIPSACERVVHRTARS